MLGAGLLAKRAVEKGAEEMCGREGQAVCFVTCVVHVVCVVRVVLGQLLGSLLEWCLGM